MTSFLQDIAAGDPRAFLLGILWGLVLLAIGLAAIGLVGAALDRNRLRREVREMGRRLAEKRLHDPIAKSAERHRRSLGRS